MTRARRGGATALARLLAVALAGGACSPIVVHDASLRADGATLAVIEEQEGQYVVVHGERFGPYRGVGVESLTKSPSGRVAWAATNGSSWGVFIDGVPSGSRWDGIAEVAWTGDGSSLVYAAETEAGWHVVGPAGIVGPFEAVARSSLRVARSGRAFAFIGTTDTGAFVFHDGSVDGPFLAAGGLSIDDGGGLVAFATAEEDGQHVHVGSESLGPYADVAQVTVAPRLGRYAATVLAHDGWSVLLDGELSEPASRIGPVAFSRSGARAAWAFERDAPRRGWWVESDEALFGPYASVEHDAIAISPDDRHVAYVAREGEGAHVLVDGKPVSDAYFEISNLAFATGAPVLGYVGKRDHDREVVVDGRVRGRWDDVSRLVLAPRGDRWLASAELAGAALVVVDGVPRRYDDVVAESLLWDDAGTSWGGIVADRDERRLWIVVDGTPTTPIEMESLVDMVRAHARGAPSPTPEFVRALRAWVREAIASRTVARATPALSPSLRD